MAHIDVKTEEDQDRGWRYEVEVCDGDERRSFNVTLSWADYDLWTHGQVPPQRAIHAAFEFLLQREPLGAIMSKFDCAVIRRYFPDVDKHLPKLL